MSRSRSPAPKGDASPTSDSAEQAPAHASGAPAESAPPSPNEVAQPSSPIAAPPIAAPTGDAPSDDAAVAPPVDDSSDASSDGAQANDEAGVDPQSEPDEDVLAEGGARRRKPAEPAVSPPPPERLEGAVEAVLLAAGEALSAERIRDLLGLPSAVHVRDAIAAIRTRWLSAGLSVEIQDVAGGHRVVTRPEFAEYVRRLWRRSSSDRLSQTLLETLSIVAYKQPVARAEIERIRGVQCGETLRGLLERRLAKVAGRSDQPGRPLLYATTTRFLEVFGLAGLEDLPSAKDLARL